MIKLIEFLLILKLIKIGSMYSEEFSSAKFDEVQRTSNFIIPIFCLGFGLGFSMIACTTTNKHYPIWKKISISLIFGVGCGIAIFGVPFFIPITILINWVLNM